MGEAFQYNKGVKQGDGLSTTLFNIALHGAISKIDKRGSIFTKSSQICAYADDVTIIARTEKDLKNVYMKLEEEANKYGLITNMNKTKYMVISPNKIRNQKFFQIEDKKFEQVKVFRYLGMIINNQNNMTETIKEKIQVTELIILIYIY
jgi:sorting nexin-29